MRSMILRLCLLAIICVPFVGCGDEGNMEAGIPKDAGAPPPMPGMDDMKKTMEKK